MKAQCTGCGGDCSHANISWHGYLYHIGCVPSDEAKWDDVDISDENEARAVLEKKS